MRITVIVKGDLEKYIQKDIERTGLSAGMSCLNLALSGMEYKEGLRGFSVLAAALENQNRTDNKGG